MFEAVEPLGIGEWSVQLHIHPAAAYKACRMIASVAEPNFDTTVQEAVVVIWFELV